LSGAEAAQQVIKIWRDFAQCRTRILQRNTGADLKFSIVFRKALQFRDLAEIDDGRQSRILFGDPKTNVGRASEEGRAWVVRHDGLQICSRAWGCKHLSITSTAKRLGRILPGAKRRICNCGLRSP
jgi:hypothetical protein